ncbi:toll/interleukin-1 receptor domain-containing protein [Citromicrobium bathyomarinum]|uniref:toll/interleukin-1 receptor domain-containing protein n=1 Tax=Citromicrobium bathyomarinum TaxID=72174 RepID=UPI00315A8BAA
MALAALADIFISYSRKDRHTASRLAELLVQSNYTVWWDQNLKRGSRFREVIEAELDQARAVIVLWSLSSTHSRWVLDEADHAADDNKLLPVRLDSSQPPMGFRQLHTTEMESRALSSKAAAFVQLLKDLEALVATTTGEQAAPSPPPDIVRIALSPLFVIHAITSAWEVERHLGMAGGLVATTSYPWNDQILEHLEDGQLDLAIYNFNRAKGYSDRRASPGYSIIGQAGRSMGGHNFSILAKTDSTWSEIGQDGFAKAIAGATVGLPVKSDMAEVFYRVVGGKEAVTEHGIKVVDVPITTGMEFFSLIPDALLNTGQNVRQCAIAAGEVREILPRSALDEAIRAELLSASRNCIIASDRLVSLLGGQEAAKAFANALWISFNTNWANAERHQILLEELVSGSYNWSFSDSIVRQAVEKILYESYRIGFD